MAAAELLPDLASSRPSLKHGVPYVSAQVFRAGTSSKAERGIPKAVTPSTSPRR
ncbi:hypothetical protein STANM309S_04223 [Streptomyces tanashiensis]